MQCGRSVQDMRVVKEANERKNEILDAAERLFGSKGFDHTSTNDILKEVGIARGTLYYHFSSKEEILDAMIERMTGRLIEKARAIGAQKDIPVLQRLTMMILSLNVDDAELNAKLGRELLAQMHKPENALMHRKMERSLFDGIIPLLTELVEEGVAQGVCQTEYPKEAVEMTFLYAGTAFDDLMEYRKEERERKITAFIYHLELLLNMERDSLKTTMLPIFCRNDGQEIS